jgi:hypothetical protein
VPSTHAALGGLQQVPPVHAVRQQSVSIAQLVPSAVQHLSLMQFPEQH